MDYSLDWTDRFEWFESKYDFIPKGGEYPNIFFRVRSKKRDGVTYFNFFGAEDIFEYSNFVCQVVKVDLLLRDSNGRAEYVFAISILNPVLNFGKNRGVDCEGKILLLYIEYMPKFGLFPESVTEVIEVYFPRKVLIGGEDRSVEVGQLKLEIEIQKKV
jgi:hypothetical protein